MPINKEKVEKREKKGKIETGREREKDRERGRETV